MDRFELVSRAASAPHVMIATDFDGTISEIRTRPDEAVALPGALDALARLAACPGVHVAVVSGRTMDDLRAVTPGLRGIWRIAEHGSFIVAPLGGPRIEPEGCDGRGLDSLELLAAEIALSHPSVRIERKRAGLAVHYREVEASEWPVVMTKLEHWKQIAQQRGMFVIAGRKVFEARPGKCSKGTALALLVDRYAASSYVIYAGDDRTDEDAIVVASSRGGAGVYVASEERPRPDCRVDTVVHGPTAWVETLERIAESRDAAARKPVSSVEP